MPKFSTSVRGMLLTAPVAAVIAALASGSSAQAQVIAGDTFNFDVISYNSTTGAGFYITPQETATFGATTTFTGAGINGQDISITSGETKSGSTITDTFTVSTPTSFITTATINGATQDGLEFDLGNGNAGTNAVDVVGPINTFTNSGSALYSGGTVTLGPNTVLSNNNLAYSAEEGVQAGGSPISTFTVHSFTYSISYAATATSPEPSAVVLALSGGLLTVGGIVRRRRAAK